MKTAFKEWAVVVDALGRGDQILILRKGGISEGKAGFRIEHSSFWLFPTQFHQQRDAVIPQAQQRFDQFPPSYRNNTAVPIQYFAQTVETIQLVDAKEIERLDGQHIWKQDTIEDRFKWGREQLLFVLIVRISALPSCVELPMTPSYGGCKSWIELEQEIPMDHLCPVLDDFSFQAKLERVRKALRKDEPVRRD